MLEFLCLIRELIRAVQDVENLPCPALPGQGGQGRARLRKFLKGRLQVMDVVTCQPAINFMY